MSKLSPARAFLKDAAWHDATMLIRPESEPFFDHLVLQLKDRGQLSPEFALSTAMAANDAAMAFHAQKRLTDFDLLVERDESRNGHLRRNVWFAVWRDTSQAYERWCRRAGLAPKAEPDVNKEPEETEDEKALFG